MASVAAGLDPSANLPVWADRVIAYNPVIPFGGWPYSSDPSLAIGAPGGPADVLRLGNGGSATLGFGDGTVRHCIVDGDGPDFVVYSTAVPTVDSAGNVGTFNQVMLMQVSLDNITWYPLPYHAITTYPYVEPADYEAGLAGVTPTVGTGAGAQGGDAFDLTDIAGFSGEACYVRLTDAWGIVTDYGDTQTDATQGGAGIDTMRVIHSTPAPDTQP